MKPGAVVLIALPQADGQSKCRPALALQAMPPFGDWLLCGISSQLHQAVPGFDECLLQGDADYVSSGVKVPSVIRLGFLASLPEKDVLGIIGEISSDRHKRLCRNLRQILSA